MVSSFLFFFLAYGHDGLMELCVQMEEHEYKYKNV